MGQSHPGDHKMSSSKSERPAILGGSPACPAGPPEWPQSDPAISEVLTRLFASGDWGRYHGPHLPELCRRLAEFHHVEHVLPCSSGTAAVELALRGLGVQADDEVILAGYDFKANFQNILCLKATPVLVDLDPETWQIDPQQVAAAVSERTRAILISHLHGGIVDLVRIRNLATCHGIPILEDACQSPGAMRGANRIGSAGDVSVLSFGGSKLLTAGRGGAILTNRPEIAERIKRYTQRGNEAYPQSEMQAALLLPQLQQLDRHNEIRRESVRMLCSDEQQMKGLKVLQPPQEDLLPAYYKVGFRYDSAEFGGLARSLFVRSMRAEGIAIDAGFRALHLIHAKRRFRSQGELLEATRADHEMVVLHHPVLLQGDRGIRDIHKAIEKVRKGAPLIREQIRVEEPAESFFI